MASADVERLTCRRCVRGCPRRSRAPRARRRPRRSRTGRRRPSAPRTTRHLRDRGRPRATTSFASAPQRARRPRRRGAPATPCASSARAPRRPARRAWSESISSEQAFRSPRPKATHRTRLRYCSVSTFLLSHSSSAIVCVRPRDCRSPPKILNFKARGIWRLGGWAEPQAHKLDSALHLVSVLAPLGGADGEKCSPPKSRASVL